MKVILFGGTGMVGSGVLLECLDHPDVESVLALTRTRSLSPHPKLRELIHTDFFDYNGVKAQLAGYDACFFCLGVSSAGMSEAEYNRLTFQLTIAAAEALAALNPLITFCYVSGEGTDSSEQGRLMWARVKGRAENQLLRLLPGAYMFRPGFIQPLRGVRSKTRLYQAFYVATAPIFPVLKRLFARHMTTTVNMGRAMIRVAQHGYSSKFLENADINALAGRTT